MKRFFILIMVLLVGCAAQQIVPEMIRSTVPYTYDGEFDPSVFLNWDPSGDVITCEDHHHIFLKNPDEDSPVELIDAIFSLSEEEGLVILEAYRYSKYGIWYIFALDEYNHFGQIEPNQGEVA